MELFLFILVWILIIRIVTGIGMMWHLYRVSKMPVVNCPPHSWEDRNLHPDDPSAGTFLVCAACRYVPSSDSYL